MASYDDIIAMSEANKGSFGMSQEEMARRQELIRNVGMHNEDLARTIASGPYRTNGASPQQAPTQAPSANNGNATSSADILRSPTVSPTGVQQRTVQGPPDRSGSYPVASPPVSAYPQQGAPVGNPRYDFPSQQQQSGPSASINVVDVIGAIVKAFQPSQPPQFGTTPWNGPRQGGPTADVLGVYGYPNRPMVPTMPMMGQPTPPQPPAFTNTGWGNLAR